jgi:response regulator RpfG family c-di-GMP phosphodiesterase
MGIQYTRRSNNNNNEISLLDSEKLLTDSHWEYYRDDDDRFTCVADRNGILICRFKGWSIKADYVRLEEVINDVIIRLNWSKKTWVLLFDCSAQSGMDIAARGMLIQLLSLQKYLNGVLFCSPSHLIKSLVKLAAPFYKLSFKFEVYKTIADGYFRAAELLGISTVIKSRIISDQNSVPDELNGNENEIDQVLRILSNVEWNKPGTELLEKAAANTTWKPFLSMVAIIKGDLDVMIQKREERRSELEENNLQELTLQQKMRQALEASQKARVVFEQESRRNIMLSRVVVDTQKEILFSMGEIIESRSRETANHIRRVAEYSTLLAKLYGLSEREQQHILHTSPMHDAGKIAIPDAVLNKPGKLTDEEFALMKEHAKIGWKMLNGSNLEIMQLSALIAYQHHEKWNGKGYPNGLKGNDIHIFGRIVALSDVFDALGSDRCYKKSWPLEKVLEQLHADRGEHFDPDLIDIFFKNLDGFLVIREMFPDGTP